MSAGYGLIVAAPASGSGKTTVTLGLLRALSRKGARHGPVRGAKSGPDYIDPRFHEAACGAPCYNLDAWAMTPERIRSLAAGDGLLLVEGAMGLFDGAPPEGKGATADLARILGLPVVLVIDAARMAQSIAPLVQGFARHDPNVAVAGVILNRVGSPRHRAMLERALAPTGLPVLGAIPRDASLELPSRHLGLVQAGEHGDLDTFLDRAADAVSGSVDLEAFQQFAKPLMTPGTGKSGFGGKAPAKRIAIAQDAAFAFTYPHQLAMWRHDGATLSFFSPLADDRVPKADLIYLPGGYPELHASRIATANTFMNSLREASQSSEIYGECGGYMVLGESLTDANGACHTMAGLLPLETSFAERRLHLGYRLLEGRGEHYKGRYAGHEFHYATTLRADGPALFDASDTEGNPLPPMGLIKGNVSGSFAHIIDRL